jgi:hypothetical protein
MKQVLLLISLSLLINSCARKKMMERVQQYNIRTIAILPAQIEVTGNIPKKLTPEQVKEMIDRNTVFLNRALYIDLVQYVDTRMRRYSQVQFQSTERTKKLLEEKGITDSASWQMDPMELSKILGVDAVVSTKVTQNHILSNEVAMGIDVVGGILNRTVPGIGVPTGMARTSDMFVSSALVREGYTVWSTRFTNQTDWNYPFQQSIQNVTRAIARRFPL